MRWGQFGSRLTVPPGREASLEQTSPKTASTGQQQDSIPERLEVWEQEGLACSGVSSWECPSEAPAALAPRCSSGCQGRWVAAACSSAALELAEKEVWVGFQGSQSPVQKSHKSSCVSSSNHPLYSLRHF